MRKRLWAMCLATAAGLATSGAYAQTALPSSHLPPALFSQQDSAGEPSHVAPIYLALAEEPASVYPEIMPPPAAESQNSGGANFDLGITWVTDYVYRGVVQATTPSDTENALQFDASAKFNLGKLPHPFIGLFVNVFNNDPVSRFEEVRPYFGAEWTLTPLILEGGFLAYIHPNRKYLDTQEVFARLTLDDARILRTAKPFLSPYVYGAYDIELYHGFYLEAGIKHDFVFEDIGLTITPKADLAYVIRNTYFEKPGSGTNYGLQHYDIGLQAAISINHLLNVNKRFGDFDLISFLQYTAATDGKLRGDTLLWGGAGILFRY